MLDFLTVFMNESKDWLGYICFVKGALLHIILQHKHIVNILYR